PVGRPRLNYPAMTKGCPIRCTRDARSLFGPGLASAAREMLGVAHLDADRRLIAMTMHRSESATGVDLPLRRIVADAIRLGSHSLLIAHNHPSGDPRPSRADLAATRALVQVTRPIGIRLHDHIVFSRTGHVSLREAGLL